MVNCAVGLISGRSRVAAGCVALGVIAKGDARGLLPFGVVTEPEVRERGVDGPPSSGVWLKAVGLQFKDLTAIIRMA